MSDFKRDVLDGLSRRPKSIPPKYFYDAEGSRLFEQICELEEYYPTRTEIALLSDVAPQIAEHIPPRAALIEFGSGASTKTRLLLRAAPQIAAYIPIDISPFALAAAVSSLRKQFPALQVFPLVEDFTRALHLPAQAAGLRRVGFFPGSTIGNFTADEAAAFLRHARGLLGDGAVFIIGIDLVKEVSTLIAAYDDAAGVTAAFNLNLLDRINRELGGDIPRAGFRHRAVWNADMSRIEMHLECRQTQAVEIAGRIFRFEDGETIHTENCHKFTVEGFAQLAGRSGWEPVREWVSPAPRFAEVLLRAA